MAKNCVRIHVNTSLRHFYIGWWLSMGKADTFFNRLQSLENLPTFLDRKNRFARDERTAHKTLGFVLVSL